MREAPWFRQRTARDRAAEWRKKLRVAIDDVDRAALHVVEHARHICDCGVADVLYGNRLLVTAGLAVQRDFRPSYGHQRRHVCRIDYDVHVPGRDSAVTVTDRVGEGVRPAGEGIEVP